MLNCFLLLFRMLQQHPLSCIFENIQFLKNFNEDILYIRIH